MAGAGISAEHVLQMSIGTGSDTWEGARARAGVVPGGFVGAVTAAGGGLVPELGLWTGFGLGRR